ncbi:hypothetical protein STEG23_021496, partial [Scotinomys teguina]
RVRPPMGVNKAWLIKLSGDFMFEGSSSHMGPLYWFPDKCCLIPGHEPAASPSFLHTTLKKEEEEVSISCVVFSETDVLSDLKLDERQGNSSSLSDLVPLQFSSPDSTILGTLSEKHA